MIQLFIFSGGECIHYGFQNLVVRIIVVVEVTAILLGVMIGLLLQINKKSYILLTLPGFAGCMLFGFINTMGRTIFSNADIWPTLLAEDLMVFSVVSCIAMYLKKRCRQKSK